MHKLIMQASHGDEKFLMKDINCEFEYDMLRKLRARAEKDRKEEAAIKIQSFFKTLQTMKLYKFVREVRKNAAIKI